MEPRLEYIRQLVRERDWSGSELARRMGISRAEANRFLNGYRKGGKKIISGLIRAFPEENLETLFILPEKYPNGNMHKDIISYRGHNMLSIRKEALKQNAEKKIMKPVKHPNAHQLACKIDEKKGIIEIVVGKNVTTLFVPIGPIKIRHTTKHPDNTS
jgi:transcriptional regulator with XRE-family HTH domain